MEELENAGLVEQEQADNNVETATTDVNDEQTEKEAIEKTFTQDQVNEFVKKRIERERETTFKRYGVKDKSELDSLISKSRSYDVMKERFDEIKGKNEELAREIAFIRQNIEPSRQEDVIAYFKGKELQFSEDTLKEELKSHPEWLKINSTNAPQYTIKELGADRSHKEPLDERQEVAKLFGLKEF